MKKSFFKKLSLGLALALVLGTTAQAGTAQAAEAWTLKKSSKTLYLNESNEIADNYDFNFKNKPEGWKETYAFSWTSSNENVATVAAGGKVQAVSVGTATIACEITEKDGGKVVDTVEAKVTVKANAADVEISNADDFDGMTFPVGQVIDLNRVMYDENGNATTKRGEYVTDYTRWYAWDGSDFVSEEAIAIDQKTGTFTLNAEGTYQLWCETYQSSTNDMWTAYDYITVVVEDATVEIDAEQKSVKDFVLTFETPIVKAEYNKTEFMEKQLFVVFEKLGNEKNELPVKDVEPKYSEDGTFIESMKVTMWDYFVDGKNYTVEYRVGEEVSEDTFVASVGKVDDIKVVIKNPLTSKKDVDNVLYVTDTLVQDQAFALTFLDANGIDVTELYLTYTNDTWYLTTDNSELLIEVLGAEEDLWLVNVDTNAFKIMAYENAEGKTFTLKATYNEYNDKTGKFELVADGDKRFFVEKTPKVTAKADRTAVVKLDSTPVYKLDYTDVSTKVAANDNNLYVSISAINDFGTKMGNDSGYFRFYSNNPQIAAVDEMTGYLTPYEEGYVRINIYYVDPNATEETAPAYVTSHSFKIGPDRVAKNLEVVGASYGDMVANVLIREKDAATVTTPIYDYVEFVLKVTDNYGDVVTDAEFVGENVEYSTVYAYNKDKGGYVVKFENTNEAIIDVINSDENCKKASVAVTTTIELANGNGSPKKLTVTLKKPADKNVVRYSVEVADVKLAGANTDTQAEVKVYGLNKGGLKVAYINNIDDLGMDVVTYVNKLNNKELTASTGSALLYTISKNNKVVNANGNFAANAVTGAVITSKTGEVLDATGKFINVATTYAVDGMDVVYTAEAGAYTITLYQINYTNGKYSYKSLASKSFNLVKDGTTLTAKAEKIVAETNTVVSDDFGRKLVWTYDEQVKAAVLECFDLKIGDASAEGYKIACQVRINGNKMYVKAVKVFKPVNEAGTEFVALQANTNLTITLGE